MVEYDTIKALGWGQAVGKSFRSQGIEGKLLEEWYNRGLPSAFPYYTYCNLGTSEEGTDQALCLELLVPVWVVGYTN